MHLYTDGSFRGKNGNALAFVAVGTGRDDVISFMGYTKMQAADSVGIDLDPKETSSTTIELIGILWACIWVLFYYGPVNQSVQPDNMPNFVIFCDSTSAVGLALGEFDPSVNQELAYLAYTFQDLARRRFGVCLLHVRGHAGNPWNEMADRIAGCPDVLGAELPDAFRNALGHLRLMDWIWLKEAPQCTRVLYPISQDFRMCAQAPPRRLQKPFPSPGVSENKVPIAVDFKVATSNATSARDAEPTEDSGGKNLGGTAPAPVSGDGGTFGRHSGGTERGGQ